MWRVILASPPARRGGYGYVLNRDRLRLGAGTYAGNGNRGVHPLGKMVEVEAKTPGSVTVDCEDDGVGATVQVDPPCDPTTYVHRVGRTARLGREGEAVLFLQPRETEYANVLSELGVKFCAASVPATAHGSLAAPSAASIAARAVSGSSAWRDSRRARVAPRRAATASAAST